MRTEMKRKQSALHAKADSLIATINLIQHDYVLTKEEFKEGQFPWLNSVSSNNFLNDAYENFQE